MADYFKGYGGTDAITVVNNNEVVSPIRIDMTEAERTDTKKYQCTGIRRNKGYWNGETVVPVEITIKEYQQADAEPKLYMAVTINKEGDTVITGSPSQGPPIIAPPSAISLSDLVKGVNKENMDFLKYFPDSMLSNEQIEYKNTALEKERIKYEEKNRSNTSTESVLPTATDNVMPTFEDTVSSGT